MRAATTERGGRDHLHGHRCEPLWAQQSYRDRAPHRQNRCSSRLPSAAASVRWATSKCAFMPGADKVAINTAAVAPAGAESERWRNGSARNAWCLSIEAKRSVTAAGKLTLTTGESTPDSTSLEWAARGRISAPARSADLGRPGGYAQRLRYRARAVRYLMRRDAGDCRVGWGAGHLVEAVRDGHADAVAMADALHYHRYSLADIRDGARAARPK